LCGHGCCLVVYLSSHFYVLVLIPCLCTQEFFAHTAHYPFRIDGIYLINSNASFNFLWGLMKGMLPKRIEKQVRGYRACRCGCVFHVPDTFFVLASLHRPTCSDVPRATTPFANTWGQRTWKLRTAGTTPRARGTSTRTCRTRTGPACAQRQLRTQTPPPVEHPNTTPMA